MTVRRVGFAGYLKSAHKRGRGTSMSEADARSSKTGSAGSGQRQDRQGLGNSQQAEAQKGPTVHFSKHAATRLKSRGINLSDQDIQDLSEAIDRLESKNARESLLLLGEHALIVGVPKRTVITAMTRREAVGSIFTNIDSTLVVR